MLIESAVSHGGQGLWQASSPMVIETGAFRQGVARVCPSRLFTHARELSRIRRTGGMYQLRPKCASRTQRIRESLPTCSPSAGSSAQSPPERQVQPGLRRSADLLAPGAAETN